MRRLADRIDDLSAADLGEALTHVLSFLEDFVLPHTIAEEGVLYPAVALAMGSSQATATMSRDHLEIARRTSQLRYLIKQCRRQGSRRVHRDIRRTLYAIDAITSLHLDEEEEIYLPLLEGFLTDRAAADLMASFHQAAPA